MFDVGFSELIVIALVALVVIGPERMPRLARTAGALFGRAQRYVNELKSDLQREMELEEINRIKSTFYDAAQSIEQSVSQASEELRTTTASLNDSVTSHSEAPAAAAGDMPHAPAQMDFWLESPPTAGPGAAPRA